MWRIHPMISRQQPTISILRCERLAPVGREATASECLPLPFSPTTHHKWSFLRRMSCRLILHSCGKMSIGSAKFKEPSTEGTPPMRSAPSLARGTESDKDKLMSDAFFGRFPRQQENRCCRTIYRPDRETWTDTPKA